VGQVIELNEFVPNIITMMGLAVGIDYSLFVLSRYREERERGLSKADAIVRSGNTASRAVFFSGATVVLALTGLLLIPERFFQAFGTGAILVVFVAVIACLTLLPALVSILGDRVNNVRVPIIPVVVLFTAGVMVIPDRTEAGRILFVAVAVIGILFVSALLRRLFGFSIPFLSPSPLASSSQNTGFWDTATRAVMRKPIISMFVSIAILVMLIVPFFDLAKGTNGISVLPEEEPTKQAFDLLNTKYGFGSDSPALVVISGNVGSEMVAQSIERLEILMREDLGLQDPDVQIDPEVQLAVLTAAVPGDPFAQDALNTIRRVRNDFVPEAFKGVSDADYTVFVGGASAQIVDQVQVTDDYTPRVFGAVLGLSFLLLLVAFRSIVIPIASIVMNLLSVGAAYGLVVLVFQKGFLIDVFGFQRTDQIEFWLPLFMFSILFGLSMDYHVFMLSRIKEHYDETGDHSESVAFGLRTTARIITGAALIMVAVFGGFALGDIAFFQSMGFGLGAAILLDATIVRSMLVPSVLHILGKNSWYFPAALNWIPNISIEGNPSENGLKKH
jgi:RND superfamily putative drug exporter